MQTMIHPSISGERIEAITRAISRVIYNPDTMRHTEPWLGAEPVHLLASSSDATFVFDTAIACSKLDYSREGMITALSGAPLTIQVTATHPMTVTAAAPTDSPEAALMKAQHFAHASARRLDAIRFGCDTWRKAVELHVGEECETGFESIARQVSDGCDDLDTAGETITKTLSQRLAALQANTRDDVRRAIVYGYASLIPPAALAREIANRDADNAGSSCQSVVDMRRRMGAAKDRYTVEADQCGCIWHLAAYVGRFATMPAAVLDQLDEDTMLQLNQQGGSVYHIMAEERSGTWSQIPDRLQTPAALLCRDAAGVMVIEKLASFDCGSDLREVRAGLQDELTPEQVAITDENGWSFVQGALHKRGFTPKDISVWGLLQLRGSEWLMLRDPQNPTQTLGQQLLQQVVQSDGASFRNYPKALQELCAVAVQKFGKGQVVAPTTGTDMPPVPQPKAGQPARTTSTPSK